MFPRLSCAAFWPTLAPGRITSGMAPSSTPGPTVGDMAGIGLYFAGAVLLPLLAGVGLDSWLHTGPVFVLVGLFVGLVSGGVAIWLKVREFTR